MCVANFCKRACLLPTVAVKYIYYSLRTPIRTTDCNYCTVMCVINFCRRVCWLPTPDGRSKAYNTLYVLPSVLLTVTIALLCVCNYFFQTGMLAPDGRSKAFAAGANGYGRGEGCGAVVLKSIKDARADGDRVLAVIKVQHRCTHLHIIHALNLFLGKGEEAFSVFNTWPPFFFFLWRWLDRGSWLSVGTGRPTGCCPVAEIIYRYGLLRVVLRNHGTSILSVCPPVIADSRMRACFFALVKHHPSVPLPHHTTFQWPLDDTMYLV